MTTNKLYGIIKLVIVLQLQSDINFLPLTINLSSFESGNVHGSLKYEKWENGNIPAQNS